MKSKNHEHLLRSQVEEMGIQLEMRGNSPVTSRVLAYLLLADPPYASLAQIKQFLQSSRSAIDAALFSLSKNGNIDSFKKEGCPTRYYRVNPVRWVNQTQKRIIEWNSSTKNLSRTIKRRGRKVSNKNIEYILSFEKFLQEKWNELFTEWRRKSNFS